MIGEEFKSCACQKGVVFSCGVGYTIACSSNSMGAYLVFAEVNVLNLTAVFSKCGQVAVASSQIPDRNFISFSCCQINSEIEIFCDFMQKLDIGLW